MKRRENEMLSLAKTLHAATHESKRLRLISKSPRNIGGTVLCVVALAVSDVRPLREEMERRRISHAADTPRAVKQELGQYFTPGHIADFMAALFPKEDRQEIKILDPGAGIGILSCALSERITAEKWHVGKVSVDAYEIDGNLVGELRSNLEKALDCIGGDANVISGDFLGSITNESPNGDLPRYTHVIMNPPYKKIRAESKERKAARAFGLETVNLYTAFMGAAIVATVDGGHIVAIVPRSFCNGTYYKPFRQFMLDRCAIERIHLFESRNTAFKDESVLQENIIVLLRKNSPQGNVVVSHSTDGSFQDVKVQTYPFDAIVTCEDSEHYINIPYGDEKIADSRFDAFRTTLGGLGLHVSTGAVVDFRTKDSLCKDVEPDCVPLLYPVHFRNNRVCWPVDSKKPNALKLSKVTEKMVSPSGYYVAVKRFSAKEENRRIVASLIVPSDFALPKIAFENHLNVFMQDKHGLDKDIAYGLIVWLNTTWIDEKFRLFSGHTQVNATDLRNLPYPSVEQLKSMGRRLGLSKNEWAQEIFDTIAKEVANEN